MTDSFGTSAFLLPSVSFHSPLSLCYTVPVFQTHRLTSGNSIWVPGSVDSSRLIDLKVSHEDTRWRRSHAGSSSWWFSLFQWIILLISSKGKYAGQILNVTRWSRHPKMMTKEKSNLFTGGFDSKQLVIDDFLNESSAVRSELSALISTSQPSKRIKEK